MARHGFRTITKADLLEVLEHLDDDALVCFSSDYGDHCHTEQVHALKGDATLATLVESAYSASGYAVASMEDGDEGLEVYVIS